MTEQVTNSEIAEKPGRLLREFAKINNYNDEDLADKLGITRAYLNNIKNGKRPISASIAISLEELTGTPICVWLGKEERKAQPPQNNSIELLSLWKNNFVGLLTDQEIEDAIQSKLLIINNFNENRMCPCGYNLQNGLAHYKDELFDLRDRKIEILHEEVATIRSHEEITMPDCLYGHINVIGRAVHIDSFSVTVGGRIHPGWGPGRIVYKVKNLSNHPATIDQMTLLAGVEFHFLPRTPKNNWKDIKNRDEQENRAIDSENTKENHASLDINMKSTMMNWKKNIIK